jgi:PBP1b-binding outer membrane lipoprotein LpoB
VSGAFGRMDHLGQDRETHGQRQSTIAQHGDLLDMNTTLDGARQTSAKKILPVAQPISW